jgi:diguanylate cyclase (GGDEF)-like protein
MMPAPGEPIGAEKDQQVEATKVLVSKTSSPAPPQVGTACLVHIYPTGPAMGSRYLLGAEPVTIGREEDCQIRINDPSVSRRHARIHSDGTEYRVTDLESTNGTYVNDVRVAMQPLRDGDNLHIGNCICRFLAGGNIEAQYHEEIHRLTVIDALTDVHNRRYLLEALGDELTGALRYRRPLALVLFDVDHFKLVNDRLGHLGGDFTLRELAAVIKQLTRKEDIFGRYGGEEFAVVMPETDWNKAAAYADRLRRLVAQHPFCYEGERFQVTISLGVASTTGEEWTSTRELLRLADQFLCRAKQKGRNRVEG